MVQARHMTIETARSCHAETAGKPSLLGASLELSSPAEPLGSDAKSEQDLHGPSMVSPIHAARTSSRFFFSTWMVLDSI